MKSKIKIDTLIPVTITVEAPTYWSELSTEQKLDWAQQHLEADTLQAELEKSVHDMAGDFDLSPDCISSDGADIHYTSSTWDEYHAAGLSKPRPGLDDEAGYWWSGSIGGTRSMIGNKLRELARLVEEDLELNYQVRVTPTDGEAGGWFLTRT